MPRVLLDNPKRSPSRCLLTVFMMAVVVGVFLYAWVQTLFNTKWKKEAFQTSKPDTEIIIQYTTGKGEVALEAQRILKASKMNAGVHSGMVDDVLIQRGLDVYRMSSIAPMLASDFTVQNIVYFVQELLGKPKI